MKTYELQKLCNNKYRVAIVRTIFGWRLPIRRFVDLNNTNLSWNIHHACYKDCVKTLATAEDFTNSRLVDNLTPTTLVEGAK